MKNAYFLFCLVLVSGCVQILPRGEDVAVLKFVPQTLDIGDEKRDISSQIGVDQAVCSSLYNTSQILYTKGGKKKVFQGYSKYVWTDPLPNLIPSLITQDLRGTGKFQAVNSLRGDVRPDFIILPTLYNFEINKNHVVLKIDIQIINRKNRKVLGSRTFSTQNKLHSTNIEDIYQTFVHSWHEIGTQYVKWIHKVLDPKRGSQTKAPNKR